MTGSRSRAAVSALLVLFAVLAPVLSGAESAVDKKKELQQIKRRIEAEQKKARQAGRKERSVLGEIDALDRSIEARNAELRQEEAKLRGSEAALAEVEEKARATEQELVKLRRVYGARVRALYKMGRSGYAVGILSSESMSAAVKRLTYLEIVAEHDRRIIGEYRKALEEYSRRRAEISALQAEISRRNEQLRERRRDLAAAREKKESLLAAVRKRKTSSEAAARELEEASRSLWEMIAREEEEARKSQSARVAIPQDGRGRLPWPVHGAVVSSYGKQRHSQFGTVVFRNGIEIETKDGEEVRAVGAGRVAYAGWYKGYGNILILDHGDGLYSLYGYLSRLDAQEGKTVAAGAVIGLAGETGGPKGSKLYFEIRRHGRAEDPLAWLAKR